MAKNDPPREHGGAAPKVWDSIISLERNQERVATALEAVTATLQDFRLSSRHEFEVLDKRIQEHGKTKWSQIFGALGFIMTVFIVFGGVIAWGYGVNLERTDGEVIALEQAWIEHTKGGHPDSVTSELDGIRNKIQSEIEHLRTTLVEAEATHTRENDRVERDVNQRINRLESALETGLYNFGGNKGPWSSN